MNLSWQVVSYVIISGFLHKAQLIERLAEIIHTCFEEQGLAAL